MKIFILASCLISGCATITNGTTQTISLKTPAACTATRGAITATLSEAWPTLKVSRSAEDIQLDCGNGVKTIKSETTSAGLLSVWLIDGGLIDMATGAMWGYPAEVQP